MPSAFTATMDLPKSQDDAGYQIELAEAELALLKQELALQHLIDTREPSEKARRQLQKLRDVVAQLSTQGPPMRRTNTAA